LVAARGSFPRRRFLPRAEQNEHFCCCPLLSLLTQITVNLALDMIQSR
jgi:hypothetical protein